MIGHGRLVFTDAMQSADMLGIFSVERNGWVTKWLDHNSEYVEAMYPPTSVLLIVFNAPKVECQAEGCTEMTTGIYCEAHIAPMDAAAADRKERD